MNSEPIRCIGIQVTATRTMDTITTGQRQRACCGNCIDPCGILGLNQHIASLGLHATLVRIQNLRCRQTINLVLGDCRAKRD